MSELQAVTRSTGTSRRPPRVSENPVDRFLIDSEKRVIVHCQKLLGVPTLPKEDQRRLERLLAEAKARLQGLASTQN